MQLAAEHLDTASLTQLGVEARRLLCAGDISTLSRRFGYALAFERAPDDAIREELASCLEEAGASGLVETGWDTPRVTYFKPNDTGLFALVECLAPTDNGKSVLIELIVTARGKETHVTLEQLSAAV